MVKFIIKRDGRQVDYDISKISNAIQKAMGDEYDNTIITQLANSVEQKLFEKYNEQIPNVENIQDIVEDVLMNNGYSSIAKKYIIYRAERTKERDMN